MAKLPADFPGFSALDAAGEATTAKLRKRIKNDTLKEIPGIGPSTEESIKAEFEELDTPAEQAEDVKEDDSDDLDGVITGDRGTVMNTGEGPSDETLDAGEKEAAKTGAEKNQLTNHDLSGLTPAEERDAGIKESNAQLIANSGAVYVETGNGDYASATAVHNPDDGPRMKVLPISFVPPQRGMRVKDGKDEYSIQGDFPPDGKPDDWLKVRSPNTGEPFIRLRDART